MNNIGIYAFSFENPARREQLLKKANNVDISINIVPSVYNTDKRIALAPLENKRNWCIFFNHLDMIKTFIHDPTKKFGIFCEDDIYLRKTFKQDCALIKKEFERLELDVLLLGYLLPFSPVNFSTVTNSFSYHTYGDDLWGAHCYMLSKKYAKYLVEKYTPEFASTMKTPFCSDWVITKQGKRALVWPPLAVEIGTVTTDHIGQINFHRDCATFLYDPQYYI